MSDHKSHQSQTHTHGTGCGHATIAHGDHKDYVITLRVARRILTSLRSMR